MLAFAAAAEHAVSIFLVCFMLQSIVTLPAQGIVRALFYRPLDACVNGSIRIEPGQPHAVIWAYGMGEFDLGHTNENRGNSCEWQATCLQLSMHSLPWVLLAPSDDVLVTTSMQPDWR